VDGSREGDSCSGPFSTWWALAHGGDVGGDLWGLAAGAVDWRV
jgi:hypothetical protein